MSKDKDYFEFLIDKALETKDFDWIKELQTQKDNLLKTILLEQNMYEYYINLKSKISILTHEEQLNYIKNRYGLQYSADIMFIIDNI
jgi:hypothetical protein